ncbi:MAG: hypothetical protein U1E60_21300 [Reyranellaceae bacterium]
MAEPSESADAAWSASIAAAVLRRGSMVHVASLVLSLAAVLAGATLKSDVGWLIAAAIVLVLGLAEFWLAARVALDADLFDVLGARRADLASFDRAMRGLGLMPSDKAGRPLGARIRGAFRLLKLQALTLALQIAVLVVCAVWA